MRRKIFMIIVLIAVTAGSFALNKILPSEYIPDEDKGAFYVAVCLPEGTSMNQTIDTLNNFSEDTLTKNLPQLLNKLKMLPTIALNLKKLLRDSALSDLTLTLALTKTKLNFSA